MRDYGWDRRNPGMGTRLGPLVRRGAMMPRSNAKPAESSGRRNGPLPAHDAQQARLAVARWLYWSRGVRPTTLSSDLFGEPAWDLILDLYIREKSGARSSVTSACIGARAPHTTALRHISALAKAGWVSRIPDEADRRRLWLALTPQAIRKLDRHFDKLAKTVEFPLGPQGPG